MDSQQTHHPILKSNPSPALQCHFCKKSSDNTYVDLFGALYSVPLIYLSIFVLIPQFINYCSFKVNLENWYINSPLCSFPSSSSRPFPVHPHLEQGCQYLSFSVSLSLSLHLRLSVSLSLFLSHTNIRLLSNVSDKVNNNQKLKIFHMCAPIPIQTSE